MHRGLVYDVDVQKRSHFEKFSWNRNLDLEIRLFYNVFQ